MSLVGGTILTLIELVGDFSFKSAAVGKGNYLPVGYVAYMALAYELSTLLRSGDKLAILNAYWDLTSNVLTYLVGWIWFGETISSKQHLGFLLSLMGGYLLQEQ